MQVSIPVYKNTKRKLSDQIVVLKISVLHMYSM